MNTLTIDVRRLADTLSDFSQAWKTGEASAPRISFASEELLWRTLTAKRWEILKAMTGAGPLALGEVARRVARDVKALHADVHALLGAVIIERDERGFVFPYDAVHVDFMLKAA